MGGVKSSGAGGMTNCKARSTWITRYHCQSSRQVLLLFFFFSNRCSSNCSWKNEIQKHTHQRKVKRFTIAVVAYKTNRQPRHINRTQLLGGKTFPAMWKLTPARPNGDQKRPYCGATRWRASFTTFCNWSLGGFLAISVSEERRTTNRDL